MRLSSSVVTKRSLLTLGLIIWAIVLTFSEPFAKAMDTPFVPRRAISAQALGARAAELRERLGLVPIADTAELQKYLLFNPSRDHSEVLPRTEPEPLPQILRTRDRLALAIQNGLGAEVARIVQGSSNLLELHYPHGKNPLILAAENRVKGIMVELIRKGMNIDQPDDRGNTALIYAAHQGWAEGVQILLEEGANIHHENENGDTALAAAAEKGWIGTVMILLDWGAKITHLNKSAHSPLSYAILYNQSSVVRTFLLALSTLPDSVQQNHPYLENGFKFALKNSANATAIEYLEAGAKTKIESTALPAPIRHYLSQKHRGI